MANEMFGGDGSQPMSVEQTINAVKARVGAGAVEPQNDSNDSGSSPNRQDDDTRLQNIIRDRLAQQSKRHAKEKAALEERIAALEGGTPSIDDEQEKKPVPPKPVEAEYRQKLTKVEKENKGLLDRLNKHRQSTLRSTVQSKLAEMDCLDPEVAFNDLHSRGLVKLDDDDNVVVEGLFENLDQLVGDYLSKREYLRRSKTTGGVGSKAPNINSSANTQVQQIINQVRSVQQGKKLFG